MTKFLGQFLALALLLALGFWMYDGLDADPPPAESVESPPGDDLTQVTVTPLSLEPVSRSLTVNGETRVNRQVSVRAQATGTVESLQVEAGARVDSGQELARLDAADLPDQLRSAKALERQRQEELDGVERLVERGLQNRSNLRAAEAAYEQALANRRAIEEQIQRLTLKAPFAGTVEALPISLGTYVSPGTEVALVLDYSPLKAHARVSEADIGLLAPGTVAQVALASGESFDARISQIATQADTTTRTFDVEVVATGAAPARAGITADIRFELDAVDAHFVSPALLTLDDSGNTALKHVVADNQVALTRVRIVRSSTAGVWVTGLPAEPRVITVGQGFVQAGETVEPVTADVQKSGALID